jgi:hypothetical protein
LRLIQFTTLPLLGEPLPSPHSPTTSAHRSSFPSPVLQNLILQIRISTPPIVEDAPALNSSQATAVLECGASTNV